MEHLIQQLRNRWYDLQHAEDWGPAIVLPILLIVMALSAACNMGLWLK